MKQALLRPSTIILTLFLFFSVPSQLLAYFGNIKWREIPKDELALNKPKIDPNADAEVLFKEEIVDDRNKDTIYDKYFSIKLFTEAAVTDLSKIDIPYAQRYRIKNIAARVIKADGTIIELDTKNVFKKEIMGKDGFKIFSKTFSAPGLEVGCILEYQYKIKIMDASIGSTRYTLQTRWPTHHSKLKIYAYPEIAWSWHSIGFGEEAIKESYNAKIEVNLKDLEAIPDLDYMLPEYNIQKWLYVRYLSNGDYKFGNSWDHMAKYDLLKLEKKSAKKYKKIRTKAEELVQGLKSEEEKARALYTYCQQEINNLSSRYYDLSIEEVENAKENKKPSHTFNRNYGNAEDIDLLYYNMLRNIGIEAKLAYVSNRSRYLFKTEEFDPEGLRNIIVYVKADDKWHYCRPSNPYLDFGQLAWWQESCPALFAINKKAKFEITPNSPPEITTISRNANLKLNNEGTIEGHVDVIYHGHKAISLKKFYDSYQQKEVTEMLKEDILKNYPSATIENLSVNNFHKSLDPFTIRYDIKIPLYAEKTGKRLFLKTCFFEQKSNELFKEETRDMPIYFPYGKIYKDKVSIQVPKEFKLEHPTAPTSVIDSDLLKHEVTLKFDTESHKLILERELMNEASIVPQAYYESLKNTFNKIHVQDKHELVLKKSKKNKTK